MVVKVGLNNFVFIKLEDALDCGDFSGCIELVLFCEYWHALLNFSLARLAIIEGEAEHCITPTHLCDG